MKRVREEIDYLIDRFGNRIEFQDKILRQHVDELNATAKRAEDTADEAKEIATEAKDYVTGVETRVEAAADNADQSAQDAAGSARDAAQSAQDAAGSAAEAAQSAEAAAGSASAAAQSAQSADRSDKSAQGHEETVEDLYQKIQKLAGFVSDYDEIELVKTDENGKVVTVTVYGGVKVNDIPRADYAIADESILVEVDKIPYTNVAKCDAGFLLIH